MLYVFFCLTLISWGCNPQPVALTNSPKKSEPEQISKPALSDRITSFGGVYEPVGLAGPVHRLTLGPAETFTWLLVRTGMPLPPQTGTFAIKNSHITWTRSSSSDKPLHPFLLSLVEFRVFQNRILLLTTQQATQFNQKESLMGYAQLAEGESGLSVGLDVNILNILED